MHISFEHNLGVRRHFQFIRFALHHFYWRPLQEPAEHHLVQVRRNRQNPPERRRRVRADRHAHRYAPLRIFGTRPSEMFGAVLLRLPVHPGRSLVVNLHSVHAHISLAGLRILRKHEWKGDESSAILGPALQYRKVQQVDVVSLPHNLLAGSLLHTFRKERPQLRQLRQHLDLVEQALRRLHIHKSADSCRHVIKLFHLKGKRHPSHAAKCIDQERIAGTLRLFKQQRRAQPKGSRGFGPRPWLVEGSHLLGSEAFGLRRSSVQGLLSKTLRHFRDLQHRIDFLLHTLEFALLLKPLHKLPQIRVSHGILLAISATRQSAATLPRDLPQNNVAQEPQPRTLTSFH